MENVHIFVIASKVDNTNAEEVSVKQGSDYAKKIGAHYH